MKTLLTLVLGFAVLAGYSQTFTEVFKAVADDRMDEDRLGYSVDINGNYAIIGAYGDDFGEFDPNMGSAYIFEKTGIDDWTLVQKISSSDQDDYDRFGYAVAIHGDLAIVGAYGEDHDVDDGAPLPKAGSAYVFQRGEDGVWTEMQKLVASDRQEDDEFGWSVDIYDSTIVVGAHHEDHNAVGGGYEYNAGSSYIYDLGEDGIWTQTQKIVGSHRTDDHVYPEGRPDPTDEDLSDLFGNCVAIWGDYIVVGAHNHDYGLGGIGTGYAWNRGKAYVFERSGGSWSEMQILLPTIHKAWDRFGYAVDIDSNLIVVGVYAEDESEFEGEPLMNAGGAYIFENISGTWTVTQKLDASDRTAGDHFGRDVAIDGNYLVIGAEQEDLNEFGDPEVDSLSNSGAAYVFEVDGGGEWTEIQKLVQSDRDNLDLFGESVAISEHTIFVGAWQQDFDEEGGAYSEDAGAGYFFSTEVCTVSFVEQDVNICFGETLLVGDISHDETGTFIDTIPSIDACDSIVTTNLIVEDLITNSQEVSICFGETYVIGDSEYDVAGDYIDTLTTDLGCDSVVFTALDIREELFTEQDLTICAGESVIVGESVYSETGEYEDIIEGTGGCDSTVVTFLEVLPEIDVSIEFDDIITMTGGDPAVETTTFQWVTCPDYTPIDGATDQTFTATENGEYAVIITDADCADTSDCVVISNVGIGSNESEVFRVFPNPNNGIFTIELSGNDNMALTVINPLGQVVRKATLNKQINVINLNDMMPGTYVLMLHGSDDHYVSHIIIQ
ncbi:MAG: T9SS type A sorting domain-containing protein [Crocinitomicaceae bacterium]